MNRLTLILIALALPTISMAQNSVATWTERIQMSGDLRFRHDYTSKARAADKSASHQERIRVRFGLESKVSETVRAKIRLATAAGQNPISANQTFTDNANKKGIYLDLAVAEWQPLEYQLFSIGKVENSFRVLTHSQILYDSDYTPEGAIYSGKFENLFVRTGGFVIQERSPQANGANEPDTWLLAGLVGYRADISESMSAMLSAGYHNFTAIKKKSALAPNSSTTSPNFFGNTFSGTGASARYEHDYQVGQVLGELRFKTASSLTTLYADMINNFYISEDNFGYTTGVTFQTLDENSKPLWTMGYAYVSVDKDATVSAINNSDFANGQDGVVGHIVTVGRALGSNASLMLTWNNAHIDNDGTPYSTDKGLLDLQVSF